MQGMSPASLTGHVLAVASLRSGARRTMTASSVEQLGAEDLIKAGETACFFGALQVADRALGTVPAEAADSDEGTCGMKPEQLLATGFAACFLGALKLASSQVGADVPAGSHVTAEVVLDGAATAAAGLVVALRIGLPGLAWDAAETLVGRAHAICPYSHASRDDVDVRLAA